MSTNLFGPAGFALFGALLAALALASVLGPAWSHRQLLQRRWPLALLAAAVPALTAALYLHLGAPAILDAKPLVQARSQHDVEGMLAAVEAKLKRQPDDAEAWYALGRSYLALQRHADAVQALAKAVQLAPKEARMLSQHAEALAMAAGGNLQGKPLEQVIQALELDAKDEKALELAGLAAVQRSEWAQAVHYWRQLLKLLPSGTEFHQDIAQALKTAEDKAAQASGLGERGRLQPAPKLDKASSPH